MSLQNSIIKPIIEQILNLLIKEAGWDDISATYEFHILEKSSDLDKQLEVVLNRVFCKECLTEWYEKATYYPEDKHYETRKYDAISGSIQINDDVNIKDL